MADQSISTFLESAFGVELSATDGGVSMMILLFPVVVFLLFVLNVVLRGKAYGPGGYPRVVRWVPGQIWEMTKLLGWKRNLGQALRESHVRYGDILYSRNLAGDCTIVLHNPKDWVEVMRQESKLGFHSDVPQTVEQIRGPGNLLSIHGSQHQLYRKIFNALLSPKALETFTPWILQRFSGLWMTLEEKSLINNNNNDSSFFMIRSYIRDTQFELMCKLLYGMDKTTHQREMDQMRIDFEVEESGSFAPSTSKAFQDALAAANRNREILRTEFTKHVQEARAAASSVKAEEEGEEEEVSLVGGAMRAIAQALVKEGLDQDATILNQTVNSLLLLLEASHGTSIYVTTSMLFLLHENRECLEGARSEVQHLIRSTLSSSSSSSSSSFPTYAQIKHELPYIDGCIQETLRLAPIIEMTAHRITDYQNQTIQLRGQTLPAPHSIFMATATPTLDPKYFPEPLKFHPERWMQDTNNNNNNNNKLAVSKEARGLLVLRSMGFGRHICLGRDLARLSLKSAAFTFCSSPRRAIQYQEGKTKLVKQVFFPNTLVKDGLMGCIIQEQGEK